jgi:hypothetical protein
MAIRNNRFLERRTSGVKGALENSKSSPIIRKIKERIP